MAICTSCNTHELGPGEVICVSCSAIFLAATALVPPDVTEEVIQSHQATGEEAFNKAVDQVKKEEKEEK